MARLTCPGHAASFTTQVEATGRAPVWQAVHTFSLHNKVRNKVKLVKLYHIKK